MASQGAGKALEPCSIRPSTQVRTTRELILKTAGWKHPEGSNPSPSAGPVGPQTEGEGFGRNPRSPSALCGEAAPPVAAVPPRDGSLAQPETDPSPGRA